MKCPIALITLLVVSIGPTLAAQVEIRSPRITTAFNSDSSDVMACVSMFIARIFPGQVSRFHADVASPEPGNISSQKLHASWVDQTITMSARSKTDNARLAIGSCSITGNGRIVSVSVRTTSVVKLARLKPEDIELAMIDP